MHTFTAWLVSAAAIITAGATLFVYLRRFARWVVIVAQGIATLAGLPEAVRELAETLRELADNLRRQLADHETRIGRVESAIFPEESRQ